MPVCTMFEERNGEAVDEPADTGMITLVYHPLGFLDRLSTTHYYSTRAAAASGCASDRGHFRDYLYTLYDNQPPEGTASLSNGGEVASTDASSRVQPGGAVDVKEA